MSKLCVLVDGGCSRRNKIIINELSSHHIPREGKSSRFIRRFILWERGRHGMDEWRVGSRYGKSDYVGHFIKDGFITCVVSEH